MPTLTQNHVRLVLITVAVLGAAALTAVLLQGRGTSTVPVGLWSLLVGALAVCGVLLPLVAAATPLSRPRSVVPAVLLFLAMTSHATFLDEQLSGFPVGWLCTMGVIVSLAGTVVLLFNALGLRRASTGTRSRLS
ncbi:hypothetical protein [Kocuria aegyptia]|uniref:Integral membrane protein n=1 Tax=Kocuria aegyptia TaxID=330943 RepID=A0ABN2KW81_9MICC